MTNCRLMFDADCSSIRWYYHTVRTEANFYESCQLRGALLATTTQPSKTLEQYERWKAVLQDEKANALAALPLAEADSSTRVALRCQWVFRAARHGGVSKPNERSCARLSTAMSA